MLGLSSLEHFNKDVYKPNIVDIVYYLFWEKGISLKEFNELPLPYIMQVIKVHQYKKEEEAKQYKKLKK